MGRRSDAGAQNAALRHTCAYCREDRSPASRERVRILQMLALLEHPEALPAGMALRLGAELLLLTEAPPPPFRCDPA